MQDKTKGVQVRFTTSHAIEGSAGHQVRTLTEREICEWLTKQSIAHKHGSEVFIVKAAANSSPTLFVPDITLTAHKTKDGKPIIIETIHNFSPKRGGLKAFAAFCKQFRKDYFTILVGRKSTLQSIPKGLCNVLVEPEHLDSLRKKLHLIEMPARS
jgi:hypothetical protein